MSKEEILKILKKGELCTLATATKLGKPEAATMAYVIKDDFTLLMCTDKSTRKYNNLQENDMVAVVTSGVNEHQTIQLEGRVRVLPEKDVENAKEFIYSIHSEWEMYFESPTNKILETKTDWIRFSDFENDPPTIKEFNV